MPRPRFLKLAAEKRERILEKSAAEFAAHGFDGASLNHILGEAGISKGAAYYYFDGKADLFATVMDHYLKHVMADAGFDIGSLTAANFWPKIRELHMQQMGHIREYPWFLGLSKALAGIPESMMVEGPLAEMSAGQKKLFKDLVGKGQQLGVIRKDLPVGLLLRLMLALDEAGDMWFADNLELMDPREAQRIAVRLFEGVKALFEPRGCKRP